MLDSIRLRLTLWYTAVLALVIGILCPAAYFIFWRNAVNRPDAKLAQLATAFLGPLRVDSDCHFAGQRRGLFPGAEEPRAGRCDERPGRPHWGREFARTIGGAKRKR